MVPREVLVAVLVAVAAGGALGTPDSCAFYSKQECANCVWNTTSDACEAYTAAETNAAACTGRGMCIQCRWNGAACVTVARAPQLPPQADLMVMMQMSFYQSTRAVVLFDWWQTTGPVDYFMSCLAVGAFAFGTTLLRFWIATPDALRLQKRSLTAVYFFVQCAMYLVMLVTMTFNVGLCLASMVGITAAWAVWDQRAQSIADEYEIAEVMTCHEALPPRNRPRRNSVV